MTVTTRFCPTRIRSDKFTASQEAALWHIGKTAANGRWSDWVSHEAPVNEHSDRPEVPNRIAAATALLAATAGP